MGCPLSLLCLPQQCGGQQGWQSDAGPTLPGRSLARWQSSSCCCRVYTRGMQIMHAGLSNCLQVLPSPLENSCLFKHFTWKSSIYTIKSRVNGLIIQLVYCFCPYLQGNFAKQLRLAGWSYATCICIFAIGSATSSPISPCGYLSAVCISS